MLTRIDLDNQTSVSQRVLYDLLRSPLERICTYIPTAHPEHDPRLDRLLDIYRENTQIMRPFSFGKLGPWLALLIAIFFWALTGA